MLKLDIRYENFEDTGLGCSPSPMIGVIDRDSKNVKKPVPANPEQIEAQREELFGALHITDWHFEYLYTLIMFDDIGGSPLFKQQEGYCYQLLRRTRQPKFTIFMLIQNWKGLSPSIKTEITALFVFKGFNQQQLNASAREHRVSHLMRMNSMMMLMTDSEQ
jgi:hypothetical protein